MRSTSEPGPGPSGLAASTTTVFDRHDEVIGTTSHVDLGSPEGRVRVDLTPALDRHLATDDGSIEVPARWVAAVRRDAIRLSLGLQDPALRATARSLEA